MATRCYRGRTRRPVHTTLGKASHSTDNDPIDLSHIRKPIDTSVFGLSQVLNLFETATDEVRRYISYECDIIYECRACRTLFRSLGNFILHKRCYCQEVFQPTSKFSTVNFEESEAEISYDADHERDSRRNSSESDEMNKKPKKLEAVLQKLAEQQDYLKISNEVARKELLKENDGEQIERLDNKLCLQKIESTTNGVFQTLPTPSVGGELMKSEVMEIHSILNNNEAILSSDGKLFTFDSDKEKSNIVKRKLTCPVCGLKFSTKKTLTFHVKYKHNETRLVYICPECKDTFANAWGVFRHLYKVHRKNSSQIRKLRDYIHSSAVVKKQDDFKKKESYRGDDIDRENQWINSVEGQQSTQMCGSCGKTFERKAALHSHSQLCIKKMAAANNPKDTKRNSEEKSPSSKSGRNKGSEKRKTGVVRRLVKKTSKNFTQSNQSAEELEDDRTRVLEKTRIEEIIFGKPNRDLPINLHSDDEDTLGFPKDVNTTTETTEIIGENSNDRDTTTVENNIETASIECISIDDDSNDSVANNPLNNNSGILLNSVSSSSEVVNLETIIEDSGDSVELIEIKDEIETEIQPVVITDCLSHQTEDTLSKEIQESQRSTSESEYRDNVSTTSSYEGEPKRLKKRKRFDVEVPSLRVKSQAYINWENSKCKSCNLKFISHHYLMKHMALHFNWQRFQCNRCMFMCYDKMVCIRHVQSEHQSIDQTILDKFVVALENVVSAEMSTDFTAIDLDKYCSDSNGAKHGLDLSEGRETNDSPKELDKQDPMVRKMIMEVIFGSDVQATFGSCSTSKNSRPARNRTSVKELQTDFLYDMNETDTEMDTLAENKVKPIKIVKNNEFDFKVVNTKEDGLKRKKTG